MAAMLPLITDPLFYAVAIPAVLLLGLSKSGFGSGMGSLATPLMAVAIPVPQAAAIVLPLLFVMDVLAMRAFRGEFDWALLRWILPFGLLGTVIGALLFRWLSAPVVAGIVGAFTLAFLAQRLLFPPKADSPPPHRAFGAAMAATSGFTSFTAHAGGPPIAAYALPLRMAPAAYTGSMAVFFFAINLSKWLPYAWLGLFDTRNFATSLVLLPLAPIGVLIGSRLTHRINPTWFYRLVYLGMLLTGIKLLWDGLR